METTLEQVTAADTLQMHMTSSAAISLPHWPRSMQFKPKFSASSQMALMSHVSSRAALAK